MQKTYWWRVVLVLIILLFMGVSYVISNQLKFGLCDEVYSFGNYQGCLDRSAKTFGEPMFLTSLAFLLVSALLFLVRDNVFLKWLRFAAVWIILTVILVGLAPVYSGGWLNINPTKESVSIIMGLLFVVLSLAKIVWDSKKQTNQQ